MLPRGSAQQPCPVTSAFDQWRRELNGQPLADQLFLDPRLDGYPVGGGTSTNSRSAWVQQPAPMFDECNLRGRSYANSLVCSQAWELAEQDRGAMSFIVDAPPEQLAIDFGGRMSDALGHVVLLGDRSGTVSTMLRKNASGATLYAHAAGSESAAAIGIGAPSLFSGSHAFSTVPLVDDRRPPSWHLSPYGNALWMVYEYGEVWIGEGGVPEQGRLLLHALDPHAAPGCSAVGFALWANSDAQRTTRVRHIRTYRRRGA